MGMIRSLAAASRFHRIDGDYQVPRHPCYGTWDEVTKHKIYWVYILARFRRATQYSPLMGTISVGCPTEIHRTSEGYWIARLKLPEAGDDS